MTHDKDSLPEPHQASIRIRPATSRDVGSVVEFNAALARVTEGKTLATSILQLGVKAVLDNPEHGFISLPKRLLQK